MNTRSGDGRRVQPPVPAPQNREDWATFSQDADFIVADPRCWGKERPIPKRAFAPFVRVARRGPEELWVRRRDTPVPR